MKNVKFINIEDILEKGFDFKKDKKSNNILFKIKGEYPLKYNEFISKLNKEMR